MSRDVAKRGVKRRRLWHIIKLMWHGSLVSISPGSYWALSWPSFCLYSSSEPCGTLAHKGASPCLASSDLLSHGRENKGNQLPLEQLISWRFVVTTKTKSCVCGLECHSHCEDACNPVYAEVCLWLNVGQITNSSVCFQETLIPFPLGIIIRPKMSQEENPSHADGLRPFPISQEHQH